MNRIDRTWKSMANRWSLKILLECRTEWTECMTIWTNKMKEYEDNKEGMVKCRCKKIVMIDNHCTSESVCIFCDQHVHPNPFNPKNENLFREYFSNYVYLLIKDIYINPDNGIIVTGESSPPKNNWWCIVPHENVLIVLPTTEVVSSLSSFHLSKLKPHIFYFLEHSVCDERYDENLAVIIYTNEKEKEDDEDDDEDDDMDNDMKAAVLKHPYFIERNDKDNFIDDEESFYPVTIEKFWNEIDPWNAFLCGFEKLI